MTPPRVGPTPPLIGLCGVARAGKDSAGLILTSHGYTRVAFADAIRDILAAVNPLVPLPDGQGHARVADLVADGWDQPKVDVPELRTLLQRLGVEGVRDHIHPDAWIWAALNTIEHIDGPVVITDCRFPNEVDMVRRWGGELWRIVRPGTGPVNSHASETAVDEFVADRVILNDGTLAGLAAKVTAALHSPPVESFT